MLRGIIDLAKANLGLLSHVQLGDVKVYINLPEVRSNPYSFGLGSMPVAAQHNEEEHDAPADAPADEPEPESDSNQTKIFLNEQPPLMPS